MLQKDNLGDVSEVCRRNTNTTVQGCVTNTKLPQPSELLVCWMVERHDTSAVLSPLSFITAPFQNIGPQPF